MVAVKLDFRVLFESFLRISPDTKIVAVVNGTSPNELFWRSEIQKELRPLEGPIDIRWYDNLPFQDILKQTSNLPPHSAIFWNTMIVDAAGVTYEGDRTLATLHATANAPIFTHDDAFFGRGVVGGPMLSGLLSGKEVGAVAARMLGGGKPGRINIEPIGFAAPKYDWPELRRWRISESLLPPGSEINFPNSETLEAMLQSPTPDLSELKEIAADIRRDDQRAADVIRELRSLLKRYPPELKDIDLNEPVREAVHFLSTLAVARNTELNSSVAPTPLPVKGNLILFSFNRLF